MMGNEFGNVNCKGPQGKAKGGAYRTESPGWLLQQGGEAAGGRGMKHVFNVLILKLYMRHIFFEVKDL